MTASSEAEQVIPLYDAHAREWAELRAGSQMEQAWLGRFAALLPPRGEVLDVGCGSGEPVALSLTANGFSVCGVDSSPALIALCRERLPDQEWVCADMRSLDLGRAFDGIVLWHSLFHLPPDDQRAMFPRIAAHARPSAALMFTAGDKGGVRVGEWQGEPLYHASLDPLEYDALLKANGFRLLERRLGDPDCGDASVWLAQMSPASGLDGSA